MQIQSHNHEVRELTTEYLDWFIDVAASRMISDELKQPELINKPYLRHLAEIGITQGTVFVSFKGGVPTGALGSLCTAHPLNPDFSVLTEIVWFVLPEYREGRSGAMLLNAFIEKAKAMKADYCTLSLLMTSAVNIASLEKRGFKMGEYAFVKHMNG